MTDERAGVAEPRIGRVSTLRNSSQIQVRVGVDERWKRMVEEVVPRDAELDFLLLGDTEILEQGQVVVIERWTLDVREDEAPVAADGGRPEACAVDVLAVLQPFARIAEDSRLHRVIRRSGN